MSRRSLALLLGLALTPALAACGGDEEPASVAAPAEQPATTQATVPTTTATTPTTTTAPSTTTTTTTTTTATTTTPSSGGATVPTTATQPSSGGAPAGCPSAVGGFVRDVRASGADCGVASEVANAWFDAIDGGAAPDAPITAAGFACSGALSGQITNVTCAGKGATVTFTASP